MKQSGLIALLAMVNFIPIDYTQKKNEDIIEARLRFTQLVLTSSAVKYFIGVLRLEAYEPKPPTKMVMIIPWSTD